MEVQDRVQDILDLWSSAAEPSGGEQAAQAGHHL